jgi:hypothetical protein
MMSQQSNIMAIHTCMKISKDVLREFIESILTEATCPKCGDPGAYVGFNDVECPNPGCSHYVPPTSTSPATSQKQAPSASAKGTIHLTLDVEIDAEDLVNDVGAQAAGVLLRKELNNWVYEVHVTLHQGIMEVDSGSQRVPVAVRSVTVK